MRVYTAEFHRSNNLLPMFGIEGLGVRGPTSRFPSNNVSLAAGPPKRRRACSWKLLDAHLSLSLLQMPVCHVLPHFKTFKGNAKPQALKPRP